MWTCPTMSPVSKQLCLILKGLSSQIKSRMNIHSIYEKGSFIGGISNSGGHKREL